MALKISYFVHGTTTDNENGIATGWLDGELSARGIKETKALPEQIKDKSFELVICSDSKRAVHSADLAFGSTHKIIQDSRLREANYGELNGKPHSFKDNMDEFVNHKFPGGESYKDVEIRMREMLDELAEKYPNAHIAFMAHQAPQLALEVICNGKSWQQAITEDWRRFKKWQPGWDYIY